VLSAFQKTATLLAEGRTEKGVESAKGEESHISLKDVTLAVQGKTSTQEEKETD